MTLRTVSLFIALLVALSQAALYQKTATVGANSPFNDTFLPASDKDGYGLNFQMPPTITISGNDKPVSVCFVLAEYGLPHWTQYNEDNCVFYLNATKTPTPATFAFLNVALGYEVGIFFSTTEKEDVNVTVTIEIDGLRCLENHYYDESTKACIQAQAIPHMSNVSWSETFKEGETKIFTYEAVEQIGYFALSFQADNAEMVISRARYLAAPLASTYDYLDKGGELLAATPLPGAWIFNVHALKAVEIELTFDGLVCAAGKAGDNCSIAVPVVLLNASAVIQPNQWMYFSFEATHAQGLLISATTANNSEIPRLFASRGQIPSFVESNAVVMGKAVSERISADIINCNREFCDVVRSIAYNVTGDVKEQWFVGIYSDASAPVTFAFWFNKTCIPNCELDNHGQCDPAGSGRCICEIDYEGIDCGKSKGLGPQYIVLIIIASLVVASAIIGFVAWAYMRRKRADYEIVS